MSSTRIPRLAVTMGDPAGIGPEVVVKAIRNGECLKDCRPVVIGGRQLQYREGKAVDPSDVVEDGRPFKNVDEFKQLLLTDKDRLARALAAKLTTYATGAAPGPVDRAALDAMVANVRDKNYGLRSLIHEVVQSNLFRDK